MATRPCMWQLALTTHPWSSSYKCAHVHFCRMAAHRCTWQLFLAMQTRSSFCSTMAQMSTPSTRRVVGSMGQGVWARARLHFVCVVPANRTRRPAQLVARAALGFFVCRCLLKIVVLGICSSTTRRPKFTAQICSAKSLQDGLTPLHWHAEKGYSITAELLLGRGADVNAVNKARGCALVAGLQVLVCLRYSGQQRGHAAELSLHAGVCCRSVHALYMQLQGARGRLTFATQMCTRLFLQNGNTPLHMAAHSGDAATVQLLLNRGADVNTVNKARGWEHGARHLGPGPFTLCLRCPSQPHAPPSTAGGTCGPGFFCMPLFAENCRAGHLFEHDATA